MADVLIRDLKPETIAYWKKRAKAHRRSLQAEIAWVLEQEELAAMEVEERQAGGNETGNGEAKVKRGQFLAEAAELRRRIGRRWTDDTTDTIREERDRSYGRWT